MAKTKIIKSVVDKLTAPGASLYDTEVKGFVARRRTGGVYYFYRYLNEAGKDCWEPLGRHGDITPETARNLAKKRAGAVADGRDPQKERAVKRADVGQTVNWMLDQHVKLYVEPNLSSAKEVKRILDVYVRPQIGAEPVARIRRSQITAMLDAVEKENGPVQADRVLAAVRKAFNWHASREDDFRSPIVKGMARSKPAERQRDRALNDQEIRDLWAALDACQEDGTVPRCYPSMIRMLLLTASRLRMVSNMASEEVQGREWLIPKERMKTTKGKRREHLVILSDLAREQLLPTNGTHVYSTDGGVTSFKGFTKAKVALDAKIAEIRKAAGRKPMEHWTPHDLRRTARSLMNRAGVDDNVMERVLAHVIPGVKGVYDVYEYRQEKRDALDRLAIELERILHPGKKVMQFPKGRRAA